jgi:hypothetical protein
MPFDKFVDMETLSEERRKAVQESLQSMSVAELRDVVKELSDFEGDPWQEKFLQVVETHPAESFYRAVTQEGGSGMGPLPEQAKRHMKEAIAAPRSGRKRVQR